MTSCLIRRFLSGCACANYLGNEGQERIHLKWFVYHPDATRVKGLFVFLHIVSRRRTDDHGD